MGRSSASSRAPRVFLGLGEIAGYYRGLSQGFRELGVTSCFVDFSKDPFKYSGGDRLWFSGPVDYLARKRAATPRSRIHEKVLWAGLHRLASVVILAWAIFKFDVFIFAGRSTFLGFLELPLLRLLGKKIIYQFHGSDSRAPYINGAVMAESRKVSLRQCVTLTRATKRALKWIDRYATAVVNIPPQAYFHERPFVNWLRVGIPSRPLEFPASVEHPPGEAGDRTIRFLHAPSHPEAKGTQRIIDTVERLRAEGLRIELKLITGQPNTVVLSELSQTDVVIDQLYADYAMPGFATEAAWYGRPVIISGYAVDLWKSLLPADLIPATHYCYPDELEQAIRRMATDAAYRHSLGSAARAFVERNYAPKVVAERYLRLAAGETPEEWLCDPNDIRYVRGCCFEESHLRAFLGRYLQEGGVEALYLRDKPELQRLIVEFASGTPSRIT